MYWRRGHCWSQSGPSCRQGVGLGSDLGTLVRKGQSNAACLSWLQLFGVDCTKRKVLSEQLHRSPSVPWVPPASASPALAGAAAAAGAGLVERGVLPLVYQ